MPQIIELSDPETALCQQAIAVYEASFPVVERRSRAHLTAHYIQKTAPTSPPNRRGHFLALVEGAVVLGIAIFSYYRDTRWGFLSYIATRESVRGNGYGAMLLRRVMQQTYADGVALNGAPPLGICFEVERPADAATEEERRLRERRLRFYQRNGAQILEQIAFTAPPLGAGLPPVAYHLMFCPLNGGHGVLTRAEHIAVLETVLLKAYGVARDNHYFQSAVMSLNANG